MNFGKSMKMSKTIRAEEVKKITGLTTKDIRQLIRSKKFPEPDLRGQYPIWSDQEIELWMNNRWSR